MKIESPAYDNIDDLANQWVKMIKNIFSNLQKDIVEKVRLDFNTLCNELEEKWREPFISKVINYNEKISTQREIVRGMFWCAEQAATIRVDSTPDRFSELWFHTNNDFLEQKNAPDYIRDNKGWAFSCIHALQKQQRQSCSRRVSIAASNEIPEDTGSIATLVLEVFEQGVGQVFQRPEDSLITYPDDKDFRPSMNEAWEAAKELAGYKGKCDGQWRVLLKTERPASEVLGRSASGAAMRGWYYALRNLIPDKEVIVMAEIKKEENEWILSGVGEIPAKTKAVAKDGGFDKIVVASEQDKNDAEEALGEKLGSIIVENINENN